MMEPDSTTDAARSVLEPQTEFWGSADIRSVQPEVTVHHDVLYQPTHPEVLFDGHLDWGVYSSIGQRVDEAAFRRGPGQQIYGQSEWKPHPLRTARRAPDASYIYGGVLIGHYGHFICTSLARLWYLLEDGGEEAKVLFHAPSRVGPTPPFFIAEFLKAAGLDASRIVTFDKPTWIERLVIPAPALVEQSHAHSVGRRTFARVGERIARPPRFRRSQVPLLDEREPVYLSKSALATGQSRLVNEVDLEAELARRGVRIVWPERLPLRVQVCLFSTGRTIMGLAGSPFHTSAFAPSGGRRLIVSFGKMNSNQLLLDRLTLPDVSYLKAEHVALAPDERSPTNYGLLDPAATAAALLDRV